MSIRLLIILLIILIAAISIIFALHGKLKKISIVAVLAVVIVFGVTYFAYLLNPPFRRMVNMKFNTIDQHRYTINNQSFYLPLPNKTILYYRTSDTQAVYITKSSFDEILNLYSSVAENDSLIKSEEKEKLKLVFKYHGDNFIVIVENSTNERTITVRGNYYE